MRCSGVVRCGGAEQCGHHAAKVLLIGGGMQEASPAIQTTVKFLCQKVPDEPPCNFTVIGEGVGGEKQGGWVRSGGVGWLG